MVLTCGCEVTVSAPARIERACEQHGHISLRDHFAGQAIMAAHVFAHVSESRLLTARAKRLADLAECAYAIADAMLKAREAQP